MAQFDPLLLRRAAQQYGTPLWLYDGDTIRKQIARLHRFDVVRYAQKACSNIHILQLMRSEGVVVDAVSLGEIERSFAAGFRPEGNPEGIIFTADLIDRATLATVLKYGITVNAGSLDMLERVGANSPGHRVWLRINPGYGHGHNNKTNTGGEHSKHGIWLGDVPQAIDIVRRHGLKLTGLHMHIGSGVDYEHLGRVCASMVDAVRGLEHDIEAISAGGGLSVPYCEGDPEVDEDHYFNLWDAARKQIEAHVGHPVRMEIEPGRFLVAQAGVLICEVHAVKETPSHRFALVDAGFNDLLRPSLYGSHHDISIVPSHGAVFSQQRESPVVIAGPLCESGDVFTVGVGGLVRDRLMPRPEVGDFLLFHDVGAYGAAMSSNYNSRPLAPELLLEKNGTRLIRRRQTMVDLLALEQEVLESDFG